MKLCEMHGLMNGANDYSCPHCRIAELEAENQRLTVRLQEEMERVNFYYDSCVNALADLRKEPVEK